MNDEQKSFPFQQSLAFGGTTFATMGLVDLLAHLGPTGLLVGGIAGYVAYKHGPEIMGQVKQMIHPDGERDAQPEPEREERENTGTRRPRSFADRLLGRFPEEPRGPTEREVREASRPVERVIPFDHDELPRPHLSGEPFLFSEVLERFTPRADRVFLARTADGRDLLCSAQELCHVALAGATGNGKSSLMRMLLLQLCKLRMQVIILNPHYTRYDIEADEDWTPFEPYLVHPPMECRKYEVIEHYLRHAACTVIPNRLERRANSLPVGKPYFIAIDELPAIVRHIKEAPEYMRVILEEGRKVGVYLISAAQDFLVKTIAPNAGGGSIRECYRTAYYVGGDATTARVLLDMQPSLIPEDELGKGVVMLRGVPSKKATQVYVPYVDNDALYRLLGPSTYKAERARSEEIDLPSPTLRTTPPAQERVTQQRESILDMIERLSDTLDEQTLQALISQLPRVREDEEDEPELYPLEQPAPPARKSRRPEEQYAREIATWQQLEEEQRASVRDFAQAMGMGETKAWQLLRHLKSLGLIQWETKQRKQSNG